MSFTCLTAVSILRHLRTFGFFRTLPLFVAILASMPAIGQVTTYHYDNGRTGATLNETTLTTSNVNANTFGKLFSVAVDRAVYAQPLYMYQQVTIPQQGVHNVVYVSY